MKTMKYFLLLLLSGLIFNISEGFSQREIFMEGHDNMTYTVTEIKAKPGESLKVTLKTISDMPASAMSHNFVLLEKGTDAMSFITEGMSYKDNEYIAPGWEDVILAKTKLLASGEKDSVSFKAPTEKGRYEYVCTFPGHFQAGMKGVLIVE